jgi:hypothetical protein
VRGRTLIIRFGVAPGDRLDNEAVEISAVRRAFFLTFAVTQREAVGDMARG